MLLVRSACFWGTDLSHLPCPYKQVVTLFTEEMKSLSSTELEWIMGRGIAEWLAGRCRGKEEGKFMQIINRDLIAEKTASPVTASLIPTGKSPAPEC